jgi:5-methyltetrahydrofolate--homocysteine methyltransferase
MPNLLDTLKERIVVFDGAMGTNLQVQNLSLDDFGGHASKAAMRTCS